MTLVHLRFSPSEKGVNKSRNTMGGDKIFMGLILGTNIQSIT